MPVELTFQANDPIALLDQIRAFCGQLNNNTTYVGSDARVPVDSDGSFDEGAYAISKKAGRDPVADTVGTINATEAALVEHREKKARKPRKVKTKDAAFPEEPPQTEEPLDDDEIEAPDQEVEDLEVKNARAAGEAAKALIKLKDETIAKLQQAFADGKVAKLRAILDTYGDGAKSFPEIEAAKFDAIAQAIEKGALR